MNRLTTPHSKALVIFDEVEAGNVWGYMLQQIGIDIVTAHTCEDAVAVWAEELPDLILLEDFNAENEELEICRSLRRESPVPILLLTNKSDEAFQLQAYQAGVDECILHPVSPRLFLAKVRAWLRRTNSLPVAALDALSAGGFHMDPKRRQLATPGGGNYKLTNLEARLLYVLMSQPGRAIDAVTLIERMWGSYGGGDNAMLKNVVYRLRRKIEADPSEPRYLLTEGSQGYSFLPG